MRTPSDWPVVFMQMAHAIAQRSKDPSFQAGAVVVDADNVVLGVGFNGPPRAVDDAKVPWETRPDKYAFIKHAEDNALWYAAAAHGAGALHQASVFVNGRPCSRCVLGMIRAGVDFCVWDDTNPLQPKCADDTDRLAVEAIIASLKPYQRFDLHPFSKVVGG